ncbi:DUF5305 domain-containing protein [Candidatus Saccharibacteria bacterium]|nr:DUF5305 domain-containing protein [Candidatus Saccharibacteria bacterium]
MKDIGETARRSPSPIRRCFTVAAAGFTLSCVVAILHFLSADTTHMTSRSTIDYRVHMRPGNSVIRHPYLGMGLTYAFDIVDKIAIDHTYQSQLSQPAPLDYNYQSTISFIAQAPRNNPPGEPAVIVDEIIQTLQDTRSQQSDGQLQTSQQIELDLTQYREKYLEIKSDLGFTITGEIRIDFTVHAQNDDLDHTHTRSMIVPISEPYFQIQLEGDEHQSTGHAAPRSSSLGPIIIITSSTITLCALTLGLFLTHKQKRDRLSSRRKIDSILRNYREQIIVTTTPVNPTAYKERVAIKDFKEMLKLAISIDKPIMFYEAKQAACFYVPKDSTLYAYIVNLDQ